MNERDLKPASTFAQRFGVKCIGYGPAGSGKTPLINTAPNPVMLMIEPGQLSMRNSNVPAFQATNWKLIQEFFKWFFESNEAKKYDTLCMDSASQMAQLCLEHYKSSISHGLKLYGVMAEECMVYLNKLFYMHQKHIYLICKMTKNGEQRAPYFPGQELNVQVPHLYDGIFYIAPAQVPGIGETQAIRTRGTVDVLARDRSGNLADLEPPDLTALFKKAMQ